MAKKKLTATQKKNRYRALQYTTFVSEFISIMTPYVVMGAVNYEEWFAQSEGWKVGLGGSLAMALLGLATLLVTKKKEDNKITSGYVTLIVGWFAVAFVFVLLTSIMDQIATIMLFGGLGLLGAFGLDLVSKNMKAKADMYKQALSKIKNDTIEKQIAREVLEENRPID